MNSDSDLDLHTLCNSNKMKSLQVKKKSLYSQQKSGFDI